MVLAFMFLILALGFFLGFPIFLTIGLSTLVHLGDSGFEVMNTFVQRLFSATTSFSFIAVPLFMLAGNIMGVAGITDRLINFCNSLVGFWRGGLAQVNVVTSMFFAGMSGSALADTAGLGSVLIPAMKKQGYERGFATAVTAASSTIGPTIPPSIIVVIYGSTFGVSVGALFAASLVPGLLLTFFLMIVTYYVSVKRNYPVGSEKPTFAIAFQSLIKAWSALLMPAIILGGIFSGTFTATEAAAVAVLYALIIGGLVYKQLTFSNVYGMFKNVALSVAGIMIILAVAQNFAWILTRRQLPEIVVSQVVNITTNSIVLTLIILLVLMIAGMFIERTVNIFILTPILLPILTTQLGMHELHAALVLIFTLGIGHITPPFGGALYTACMVGETPMEEAVKFVLPFIIGMVILAILIAFVPAISTLLPNLMGFTN